MHQNPYFKDVYEAMKQGQSQQAAELNSYKKTYFEPEERGCMNYLDSQEDQGLFDNEYMWSLVYKATMKTRQEGEMQEALNQYHFH